MNKKQGRVNLARHLIGDRAPTVKFIGIGIAATAITGCAPEEPQYLAFTSVDSCEKTLGSQCKPAYDFAEREARRTSIKYLIESQCKFEFGFENCVLKDKLWQPKMAGFITHKSEKEIYTIPFFTTSDPSSKLYQQAFSADGLAILGMKNIDGKSLYLPDELRTPRATYGHKEARDSLIEQEKHLTRQGDANSIAAAIILAEVLDETGDYVSSSAHYRNYKDCKLRSNNSNCYTVTSGTSRVSSPNAKSHYKSVPSTLNKTSKATTKKVKAYESAKPKKTVSKGGFGKTGSAKGGWGG